MPLTLNQHMIIASPALATYGAPDAGRRASLAARFRTHHEKRPLP
jgi:hypothetical protein